MKGCAMISRPLMEHRRQWKKQRETASCKRHPLGVGVWWSHLECSMGASLDLISPLTAANPPPSLPHFFSWHRFILHLKIGMAFRTDGQNRPFPPFLSLSLLFHRRFGVKLCSHNETIIWFGICCVKCLSSFGSKGRMKLAPDTGFTQSFSPR